MKITMLGTGNALVTECYNTCFVVEDRGGYFLVDGGGGNALLHQLKAAGIDRNQIHHIFVTHKHLDHILGVLWMMRVICQAMNRGAYEGDAYVYSHREVLDLLQDMAEKLIRGKDARLIGERLHLVEVRDGETREIGGRNVTFFDIGSTKAKQFGFCMEMEDCGKLTCCGDEPCSQAGEAYAAGSDWLLHEAFCLYSQREVFGPYEKHHCTVKEACELAERLKVKNLVLYHTEDKNLQDRKRLYAEEGAQYFRGNLYIPDDLEVLEL
ncbi:MAG: MBL fold metallo-hydrolase [Lachnospiraceae bacterium]|nr:MBL fold metallo-hydrolase [Lachnospiraceae bacterium]